MIVHSPCSFTESHNSQLFPANPVLLRSKPFSIPVNFRISMIGCCVSELHVTWPSTCMSLHCMYGLRLFIKNYIAYRIVYMLV